MFDLATDDESVWANIEAVCRLSAGVEIMVSPAVQQALVLAAVGTPMEQSVADGARVALSRLQSEWRFSGGEIDAAYLGVCEEQARRMIKEGLLHADAWHSAFTIVESACRGCRYLLSHDPELLEVSYPRLKRFLEKADWEPLWIGTPAQLRANFVAS